jgi:hypothetical protein
VTKNELELINIIRNANNPEDALVVAALTIIDFLKQHESFEEPSSVVLPALA